MNSMFSRPILVIALLCLSLAPLHAQEDPPELPTNETLIRLLSYESRVLESNITIAVVVRGEANLSKQFKTKNAIHVTFLWPVSERGRRVRKSETRVFMWNEQYGWFSYAEGERRGLAVIDICSEKLGMVEIK